MSIPSAIANEPIELEETEHLLLWATRAMAVGRGDCRAMRRAFHDACGPLADQALTSLFVALKQFAWKGRRPIRLHAPGCSLLSCDEQALLAAFATAQDFSQGPGRLELQLTGLLGQTPDPAVCSAVRMTALLLSRGGGRLPQRELGFPAAESPMKLTLH